MFLGGGHKEKWLTWASTYLCPLPCREQLRLSLVPVLRSSVRFIQKMASLRKHTHTHPFVFFTNESCLVLLLFRILACCGDQKLRVPSKQPRGAPKTAFAGGQAWVSLEPSLETRGWKVNQRQEVAQRLEGWRRGSRRYFFRV